MGITEFLSQTLPCSVLIMYNIHELIIKLTLVFVLARASVEMLPYIHQQCCGRPY